VSEDQDFFFEEEAPAKASQPSKGSKSSGAARPSAPQSSAKGAVAAAPVENMVSYTNAALIAVVTLLVGVIIGVMLPIGASNTNTNTPAASSTGTAPSLTPEDLESGELPPGHPSIGGGSGAATGSAPGTTTTP